MNGEDLKFLANRAEGIRGRADRRLDEVHARIRTARRRRAVEAAGGATAAVVAVVLGIAALTGPTGSHQDNAPPISRTTTGNIPTAQAEQTARKLVYSTLPIRTIHVGDQTVDVSDQLSPGSDPPIYLNTTDDGVVFTVDAGASPIRFTDGTEVVTMGQVGGYTHIGPSPVATGTSGSLAAWVNRSADSAELVIYDTARLSEVARIPCSECASLEVVGSHVYWDKNAAGTDAPTSMYDAASNTVRPASEASYLDDLATLPRGLLVGDTSTTATPTSGIGLSFAPVNGRLVALRDHGEDPANETTTRAFDTASGAELSLRVPDGYRSSQMLNVFDWLDDDRLALIADGDQGIDQGQILVCRISTDQCRLALPPASNRRWPANATFP